MRWIAIGCSMACSILGATAGVAAAADPYRPQYHFSPRSHWINDPNGLVVLDGVYHLFYQYNPQGERWGHMSWGHARSTDLVHWQELPVAIPEDATYMIFSGSVVVDRQNTSGFAPAGGVPLVAVYTGARRGADATQTQQLAYSLDRGRTWTKYPANPVLDLHSSSFRDPKVFWYEPNHEWVMVTVLAEQKKVAFFESKDLKTWSAAGTFGPAGVSDGAWECPDLLALPVANAPGEMRWVLKVDVYHLSPNWFARASITGDCSMCLWRRTGIRCWSRVSVSPLRSSRRCAPAMPMSSVSCFAPTICTGR